MSAHAPKIRALLAYEAGELSQAGRERLERHLAGCDICREQWVAMQTYGELSQAIRAAEIPSLDYGRMELALRREARAHTKGTGRGATWAVLALAAAVLLGVLGVRQRFVQRPQASRLPDA
ncbi:MAG: zf-HC2 domain-containing protein, partial [Deltaproteobacteria bacterium]|nr:zf-HC2 domain-containing protein [Deltaproteobacteria bacterium]